MKVDFYIAGIQKSGTTNLAYLLSQSSNIVSHPQMECTFYWDQNEYNKGVKFLRNYYFFNTNDETLNHHFVLLKHSNSFTNVQILQKILKDNPNVHFLLVFRNPVQRY
ncbi:MAG: sulfotransferase domain-containing protein, partial [Bacteroidia bacterium]|nr:sulfotransferase domain-containing protein [Bacteroidia bacterium]